MVARVTRLVAEKFVLSTFPRALTTLSSMCSRAVRALESSPGPIMMMDRPTASYGTEGNTEQVVIARVVPPLRGLRLRARTEETYTGAGRSRIWP